MAQISQMDDIDSIVAIFEDKRNDITVQQIKLKAEKEIIDHMLEQIRALKETRAKTTKKPSITAAPKPVKPKVVEPEEPDELPEDEDTEDEESDEDSDEDIETEDSDEDVEDEDSEEEDTNPEQEDLAAQSVAKKMTERFKPLPPAPPKAAPVKTPAPVVEPPITPAMEEKHKLKLQLIKKKEKK